MRKWKRVQTADGPRFVSVMEPDEANLLRGMAVSVRGMLEDRRAAAPSDPLEQITGIRAGNSSPPEDATMRRLLPDFVRPDAPGGDDGDAANSALRSLHEPGVIDAKMAAVQRLLDDVPEEGGRVELTEDGAEAWIAAVNDMRLALGTMLGVGPEGPVRLPAGHPNAAHMNVYQWLTVLQEYLVLGLMGKPIR